MAIRTTSAHVLAVLDPETGVTAAELDAAHIPDANTFVDAYLLSAGLSVAVLELIETYIAADYAVSRKPIAKRNKMGDESAEWIRSDYWTQAKRADPSGTLDGLDEENRQASIFTVGST